MHLCARHHVEVSIRAGVVHVVGVLGKHAHGAVGPAAHLGYHAAVLKQEGLMAAGTVHIVQFQPHALGDEVELVAQGYIVHPSASRALEGIHRPYCLPHAMASVPHQRKAIVVVIANIRAEGAVAKLEGQPVIFAETVCHTGAKLIAPYVVPVLAVTVVYVYGRTVVFISANCHHLLAGRYEPVLVGGIVQHHPVGGVPEVALGGDVQALAPRETQSLVEPRIQAQVEKLATEPRTVIFCHT